MKSLDTKVGEMNRVGKTTARRLDSLGINTVRDLLFHFPFRYEDYSRPSRIGQLRPGQNANIVGAVELIHARRSRRRRLYLTEAIISDGADSLKVIWFNQPYIARQLAAGDRVSLAGRIEGQGPGELTMVSPAYEKIGRGAAVHTQGLVPVYHLTAGLTGKQLRFLVKEAAALAGQVTDWLPAKVLKGLGLLPLPAALRLIHFPRERREMEAARRRLAFNELFLAQLRAQVIRRETARSRAPVIRFFEAETKCLVSSLPFALTGDQRRAAWEILNNLKDSRPMTRLLTGDVGSGKTLVAVIAALNTALTGQQTALMVPTEILAEQHYRSLTKLLAGFPVKIGLLTGSAKTANFETPAENKPVRKLRAAIAKSADILIGTHALIQDKNEYGRLALVIIDEQHRFGVAQRKKLKDKSGQADLTPHFLSMTATPIPRSLALALYGDLDVTQIREMPRNRRPVLTKVVPETKRQQAYGFIRREATAGRQIFVICPLVDPSDKLGVKSAKAEYEKLKENVFPGFRIGLVHGRMAGKDKDAAMADFAAGRTEILVATAVVEVGIDVPNATVMMIEGADRFGLAQLHQFRGRVGRGAHQSYCFLFTDAEADPALKRLKTMEAVQDGFALARADLKHRGPGEVYGTAQKGFIEFKIASLFDYELMKLARAEAVKILDEAPDLNKFPLLKKKLVDLDQIAHEE